MKWDTDIPDIKYPGWSGARKRYIQWAGCVSGVTLASWICWLTLTSVFQLRGVLLSSFSVFFFLLTVGRPMVGLVLSCRAFFLAGGALVSFYSYSYHFLSSFQWAWSLDWIHSTFYGVYAVRCAFSFFRCIVASDRHLYAYILFRFQSSSLFRYFPRD